MRHRNPKQEVALVFMVGGDVSSFEEFEKIVRDLGVVHFSERV